MFHNFRNIRLQIWPLHFWVGRALSVNKIWRAYFSENEYFKHRCQLKQKAYSLANWSLQSMEQDHRNGIWNDPICLAILSTYSSIHSYAKDNKTKTKTNVTLLPEISHTDTQSQYREQRFSICRSKIQIFGFHQNWMLQAFFCSKTFIFNGQTWYLMTVSGLLNCNAVILLSAKLNFPSPVS